MDTENQRLARLLFKNESQDSIVDLIQNPEFSSYVQKLGSFNVEELSKEPIRLKNEKQHILEQTQDLAFKNYKTFIQTAECSREIFKQFRGVEETLDSLVEKIPKLEQECEKFANTTKDINKSRHLNTLTLTRNAQLLEILELAQLMESFIKDEQYENALELTNYVRRLGIKHPDITIFKSLVTDVEKWWLVMLQQLLEQLRSDIDMPKCLEVVGYLRRMEIFNEGELRLKFLQARNCWLKKSLTTVTNVEPHERLIKTIELTRVCLFNITTQYRAIFNDDEHGISNVTMDKRFNENVIFYSWLHNKIQCFIKTLKSELHGENIAIDTILSKCMYFGLSFSKVGCDFRGLLIPIFTEAILEKFQKSISKATREFERNMEKFTLINKKSPGNLYKSENIEENTLQPPESLLEFYPLAEFCNQILTAFNELKLCAPYATIDKVVECLQNSLVVVSRTILEFYGQEQQAFSVTAKEAFLRLCVCHTGKKNGKEVFSQDSPDSRWNITLASNLVEKGDLVPYLQKCLHILFTPGTVSAHLGISVQTINKSGLINLDRAVISEPISHLLPTVAQKVDENPPNDEESNQNEEKSPQMEESEEISPNIEENIVDDQKDSTDDSNNSENTAL